jgi:hypothetical protein
MASGHLLRLMLVCATFCVPSNASAAAETTGAVGVVSGSGIERGVARLVCRGTAPRVWRQSRAFVVDTRAAGPRSGDLLLAAAHALPSDPGRISRDCTVHGVNGPPAAIVDAWRPEPPRSLSDDWAILMTAEPLAGDVGRLRMVVLESEVLEALATDAAAIKLLLYADRSGLGDCNLLARPWVRADELGDGIFAHSCRSRPGLSGSPIVVRIAGEPVAIGINLGYRLRPPQLEGPLFYGIGRAFDAEIAATIDRAVQRAAHTPAAAGR